MTEHLHEWYVDLVPAYALGAADTDERRTLEQHLKVCADCRKLVADYRSMGNDLLYAAPLAPAPAGLTEDLRKRLGAPDVARPARRRWSDFLRSPALLFGLVALALLLFTNVYWMGRVGQLESEVSKFTALAKAPGVSLQVSEGQPAADGVVYAHPESNVALLCVYDLPKLEQEKTYQAWLIRDGQRVSAGTFDVNPDGYGVLLMEPGQPMGTYQQLGITVEPEGGSPAPTTPRIMGGGL